MITMRFQAATSQLQNKYTNIQLTGGEIPGDRQSLNPLETNVPNHIEISQLICNANQLTGFYMMGSSGRSWIKWYKVDAHLQKVCIISIVYCQIQQIRQFCDVITLFHIFIIFYLGIRDRRQILCLTLSKFSKINLLLFPLKSLGNLWFSIDFRGIRSLVIQLMLEAKFGDDPLSHA